MRSALGVRHGIHRYGITLHHYIAKQGPKQVILDGFAVIFHKSLTYCKNCAKLLENGIIFSQIAMIKPYNATISRLPMRRTSWTMTQIRKILDHGFCEDIHRKFTKKGLTKMPQAATLAQQSTAQRNNCVHFQFHRLFLTIRQRGHHALLADSFFEKN